MPRGTPHRSSERFLARVLPGAAPAPHLGFIPPCEPRLERSPPSGRALDASLRTWPIKAAKAGNIQMLVWLGKQLLGQRDTSKVEQTGPDKHEVQLMHSDAEREQVNAFPGW